MTDRACPDLATVTPAALAEETAPPHVRAHLAGCPSCQSRVARLEELLELPRAIEPPPAVLEALLRGIAREQVAAAESLARPAAEPRRVALACCYCHGAVERADAAFCAACLAPHHGDCFQKHGRCAAPGCSEALVVHPTRPGRAPRRRFPAVVVSAAAVVGAACGVIVTRNYLSNLEDRHRFDLGLKPFYVAARDIPPGSVITEADIETRDLPGRFIDEALRGSQIVEKSMMLGVRTVESVTAGQVFVRYHFPDPRDPQLIETPRGLVLGWSVDPWNQARWPFRARRIQRVAWRHACGEQPGTPLPGPDGRIYVLAGGGALRCLDANGTAVWVGAGDGQPNRTSAVLSPLGPIGGAHGGLRALSLDGQVRWHADLGAGWFQEAPVLSPDGATLFVAGQGIGLTAVDASTGAVRWSLDRYRSSRPALCFDPRGRLLAAFPNAMLMCIGSDGRTAWEQPTNGAWTGSLVAGRSLILWGEASLARFELAAAADQPPTPDPTFQAARLSGVTGVAALSDRELVAALRTGELVGLETTTGRELWRQRISTVALGPPAATADGEVLVVDARGKVHLATADRRGAWAVDLGGAPAPFCRPAVDAQGRVYVSVADTVYCLDANQ